MLVSAPRTTVIRNYAIAACTVILMSAGMADLFNNPARVAQQDRIDGFGRYVSAGLVNSFKEAN